MSLDDTLQHNCAKSRGSPGMLLHHNPLESGKTLQGSTASYTDGVPIVASMHIISTSEYPPGREAAQR